MVDEIIERAANELARIQLKFDPKRDKDDQEKMMKLMYNSRTNADELTQKLNSICGRLKSKYNLANISENMMTQIANLISKEVGKEGFSISSIEQNSEIVSAFERIGEKEKQTEIENNNRDGITNTAASVATAVFVANVISTELSVDEFNNVYSEENANKFTEQLFSENVDRFFKAMSAGDKKQEQHLVTNQSFEENIARNKRIMATVTDPERRTKMLMGQFVNNYKQIRYAVDQGELDSVVMETLMNIRGAGIYTDEQFRKVYEAMISIKDDKIKLQDFLYKMMDHYTGGKVNRAALDKEPALSAIREKQIRAEFSLSRKDPEKGKRFRETLSRIRQPKEKVDESFLDQLRDEGDLLEYSVLVEAIRSTAKHDPERAEMLRRRQEEDEQRKIRTEKLFDRFDKSMGIAEKARVEVEKSGMDPQEYTDILRGLNDNGKKTPEITPDYLEQLRGRCGKAAYSLLMVTMKEAIERGNKDSIYLAAVYNERAMVDKEKGENPIEMYREEAESLEPQKEADDFSR